jgi:hypothetical protein
MIELALIMLLSIAATMFASLYFFQVKKTRMILANTLKLLIMHGTEQKEEKTDKEKANEDFLKFVSDSRDWAYEYIEDVQLKLKIFIDEIEPEISYFDEYGLVGDAYPHYHSMKKISQAYKELTKLLPEDYGRIDT